VTDLKSVEILEQSLKKIKKQKIKLVLGRHREIDFKTANMIVQNPGVPRESKYLKIARNSGIFIENEASLFFKNCPAPIIGVTGTRGKSTTTSLVHAILKAGWHQGKVWLAGLPQRPMLNILDQIKPNDFVVLELSSWQLEILGQQKLSPKVAVLTNIYPDHLNRYRSMTDYAKAKENIFKFQNNSDFVVLNFDNFLTRKMGKRVISQRFWFSKKYFADQQGSFVKGNYVYFRRNDKVDKLVNWQASKLIGQHNLENILAASTVAGIFEIKPKIISQVLRNFSGLPSRLELIRTVKGVKYINDTTATTPDGTIAALKALGRNKKIVLIAGGETKNIPNAKYNELAGWIKKTTNAVVLFSGRGSDQLLPKLKKLKFKPLVFGINDMGKAVSLARSLAKNGDIVLLSPACASFNLFNNEFDRGDQFNALVEGL
jgi:UDP-N-acetylmuramoylalanine--D-glutamate ligase